MESSLLLLVLFSFALRPLTAVPEDLDLEISLTIPHSPAPALSPAHHLPHPHHPNPHHHHHHSLAPGSSPHHAPAHAPAAHHHHHHAHPPAVAPVHPPAKAPAQPPTAHAPVHPPTHLPVHPPTHMPPTHLPVHPPAHLPPPHLPVQPPAKPPTGPHMQRSFIAVQGVVYCKSCKYAGVDTLVGATPLLGAEVKLACNSSSRPVVATAKTDKNGYFFLTAPKTITSYAFHKCKVSLISSPQAAACMKPSNLHGGLTGAILRPEKPFMADKLPFVLYTVGPLAFEPKCPR